MKSKSAFLTVQKWGNSLAVRIPASIARNVNFHSGTPVLLFMQQGSIIVQPTGEPKLSLNDRLKQFDPKKHGGEIMPSKPIGMEKF